MAAPVQAILLIRLVVKKRKGKLDVIAKPQVVIDRDSDTRSGRFDLPPEGVNLDDLERDLIRQALQRHEGNRTHAAKHLGLTRQTLLYRMQKYVLR